MIHCRNENLMKFQSISKSIQCFNQFILKNFTLLRELTFQVHRTSLSVLLLSNAPSHCEGALILINNYQFYLGNAVNHSITKVKLVIVNQN